MIRVRSASGYLLVAGDRERVVDALATYVHDQMQFPGVREGDVTINGNSITLTFEIDAASWADAERIADAAVQDAMRRADGRVVTDRSDIRGDARAATLQARGMRFVVA
jgi:hypothetical protein